MHRDIKPENILLKSRSPDLNTRLTDFGLSSDRQDLKTFCGTQIYLAPEVRGTAHYTNKVDIWSLGVVALELVYNLSTKPSARDTISALNNWPKTVSKYARKQDGMLTTLLQRMLDHQPNFRPSADECLQEMENEHASTLMPNQEHLGLFGTVDTESRAPNASQSLTEDAETITLESQSNTSSRRKGKFVALSKDVDEENAETIRRSKRKGKNYQRSLIASHRRNMYRFSVIPTLTPYGQSKRRPNPKKILGCRHSLV